MLVQPTGRAQGMMSTLGFCLSQFPRWCFPLSKGMTNFFNQFHLNCTYPHLGMICTIADLIGFREIVLDRAGLSTQLACCAPGKLQFWVGGLKIWIPSQCVSWEQRPFSVGGKSEVEYYLKSGTWIFFLNFKMPTAIPECKHVLKGT